MKTALVNLFLSASLAQALADPQITSWFTAKSGQFARIYRTDAEKSSGQAETTWSNGHQSQSQPAFNGVQQILSSTNWIYIRSTGLGSQVMGPWFNDAQHRFSFPNLPTDQHYTFAIPRHPAPQTTSKFSHLGEIGMFVDGVAMFDANDAFSYSNQDGRDANPRARIGRGDGIWNRDAFVNEGITFDAGLGHQQQWGTYHYHAEPLALRYLLGDHVDLDPATMTYHESWVPATKHSPILGWMQDGYPIYGPYGFSNATNRSSGVRRMVSGFVPRNGQNGADNLGQTGRRSLPLWAARIQSGSITLASSESGPDVSAAYPIGHYIEDNIYLCDAGKKLGKDFDLDESNGRWCVTPEYPGGTFAYFTTIDAAFKPVYPYTMGRRFHGKPAGRFVEAIYEPVTTNFVARAGADAGSNPRTQDPGARTLTWNSATGHYEAR